MGIQIIAAGLALAGLMAGSGLGDTMQTQGNPAQVTNTQCVYAGDCVQERIMLQDYDCDQTQDQIQLRTQDCINDPDCTQDQLQTQDRLQSCDCTGDQLRTQGRTCISK